jgi:hypothetical protein
VRAVIDGEQRREIAAGPRVGFDGEAERAQARPRAVGEHWIAGASGISEAGDEPGRVLTGSHAVGKPQNSGRGGHGDLR